MNSDRALDARDMPVTAQVRRTAKKYRFSVSRDAALGHFVLLAYVVVACGPVVLIIMNSFKTLRGIFESPFSLPDSSTFSLDGYAEVLQRTDMIGLFLHSAVVTVLAVGLVLILGSMVAHAIVEYRLPAKDLVFLYFILGILIPIRLGTVSLIRVVDAFGLTNSLVSLVFVYTAMCMPMAVFIFRNFFERVPQELKDAARIDGAGDFRLFWDVIVPIVRPGVGTVAVFAMIPMWNDLWFASVLAPSAATQTVPLGVQVFIGQYTTDWPAVLASLTLAMVPLIVLYMLFARQLVRGLTEGAVK